MLKVKLKNLFSFDFIERTKILCAGDMFQKIF